MTLRLLITIINLIFFFNTVHSFGDRDIEIIRGRIFADVMKSLVDDSEVETLLKTFTFDSNWDIEDVYGLTDTHEKSINWNDVDDGLWDNLMLNEN